MTLSKGYAVLALIIVAGGAYLIATQTWINAFPPATGAAAPEAIPVTGQDANPVLPALGLVSGAAALFLALARRVGRWVSGVVIGLAALGYGAATIALMTDPAGASRGQLSADTGLDVAAQSATLTAWPPMALAVAAVQVLLAVVVLVSARTWGVSHKYERATTKTSAREPNSEDGTLDTTDSWDALTRGEDPS